MAKTKPTITYSNGRCFIDGQPIDSWTDGRVVSNLADGTWELKNKEALINSDDPKSNKLAEEDVNSKPKSANGIHITVPKRPTNYDTIMKPVRRSRAGRIFGLNHFFFDPGNAIGDTENCATKFLGNSEVTRYIESFFDELAKSQTVKSNVVRSENPDELQREEKHDITSTKKRTNESMILEYDDTVSVLDLRKNSKRNAHAVPFNDDEISLADLEGKRQEVAQSMLEYLNVTSSAALRLMQANVSENMYGSEDLFGITQAFKILEKSEGEGMAADWKRCWQLISGKVKRVFDTRVTEKYVCSAALNSRMDRLRNDADKSMKDELARQAATPESTGKIGKATSMHSRKIRVNLPKLQLLWSQTYSRLEQDQPEFLREFTAGEVMNYFKEVMMVTVPQVWAAIIIMIRSLDPAYMNGSSQDMSKPNRESFLKMRGELRKAGYWEEARKSYGDVSSPEGWEDFLFAYNEMRKNESGSIR